MINNKIVRWSTTHAILMIIGMIFDLLGYQSVFPTLALISFLLFFGVMEKNIRSLKPAYGPGNWVTLIRFAGWLFIGFNYSQLSFFQIGLLSYFLVALDGVDGFVARQTNTISEFGAWFDMEVDAFYVALMSVILYNLGLAGAWILIPGFLRYVFSLGIWIFNVSDKQETSSKFGKYIAGFMFVALPLPFLIPLNYATPILAIASLAIVLSFGRSIYLIVKK
jgi:phosphatidylglycerophosphate synthase